MTVEVAGSSRTVTAVKDAGFIYLFMNHQNYMSLPGAFT